MLIGKAMMSGADNGIGRCFDFNGTNQYLGSTTLSTNIVADGKFAVCGVVNIGAVPFTKDDDILTYTIDGDNQLYIRFLTGTNYLRIYGKADGTYTIKEFNVSSYSGSGLIHIAVVFDNTYWRVYIENNETIYGSCRDMSLTVGNPAWFTGRWQGSYFNGKMFDVRFFNKALTADEVSEIYNREYASYVNLVTNGTFDSADGWTITGGTWSIAAGVASRVAGSGSYLKQNPTVITGKTYKLKYEITSYTSGTFLLGSAGAFGAVNLDSSAIGVYEKYITCFDDSVDYSLGIYSTTFVGSIDNIELHEISEDVTFDTSDLYRDCVCWLKMNETSGTVAYDSTSNGNNFAINNGDVNFFSTQNIHEFLYGGNILENGGLESWASPTNLDVWVESIGGTSTINQESSDVYAGNYSARYDIDAVQTTINIQNTVSGLTNLNERRYGFWIKASDAGTYCRIAVINVSTSNWLQPDGSWGAVIYRFEIPCTTIYTRHELSFSLERPTSADDIKIYIQSYNGASKSIYIDAVTLQEKVGW